MHCKLKCLETYLLKYFLDVFSEKKIFIQETKTVIKFVIDSMLENYKYDEASCNKEISAIFSY